MLSVEDFIAKHDYPCWCGQQQSRLVCKQFFGRRSFAVLECIRCKTHRILPKALASQQAAEHLYNEYELGAVTQYDLESVRAQMFPRLQEVGIAFTPQTRVLDVGCGSGTLLNAVCKTFGCAGLGIDVDKRRISVARGQASGAQFECGLFDSQKLRAQFDVVISNAVIEHVVDPVKFLRDMSEVLRPNGQMFVLTPNAASLNYRILRSWWRELLSIGEHIYLFTPESLASCARSAGLGVAAISSAFDFGVPQLSFKEPRDFVIGVWSCYREMVKRATGLVSTPRNRDILYARLAKLPNG
jgi:2-polyprenyl-3-methyl-5-hydroxy-6-metoxy-1,4-benzoquinol methylase